MLLKLALILASVLNVAQFGDAASGTDYVDMYITATQICSESVLIGTYYAIFDKLDLQPQVLSQGQSLNALAPFITKCKAEDTDCITANAVKAIPFFSDGIEDLGVETLDPSFFELIDASKPNLKFLMNDVKLTGLKNCKPHYIRRDPANSKISLKLDCAVECHAKYVLSGNILNINIEGEGPMDIKAHLVIDLEGDFVEVTGEDDKKHFHINKFTYTYDFLDKSQVEFKNLFPDNEVLRKAANDLMKDNGNEVVKEVGDPMIRATATKVIKNVNNFLKVVPIEELALD